MFKNLLDSLFKLFLVLFIVGGIIVTVGQVIGVAIGSEAVVVWLNDVLVPPVCILAGVAGLLAFVGIYTTSKDPEPALVE